jgi:hypothetical protein
VCGSTPLVLWYSSFTGVNVAGVESVLCTADSTQLAISNSTFSSNRARAIQARDTANVTVRDSKISINQCYTCSYEAQKAHASHSLISRR